MLAEQHRRQHLKKISHKKRTCQKFFRAPCRNLCQSIQYKIESVKTCANLANSEMEPSLPLQKTGTAVK